MATVYLATDLKHDREVALKVLRPELGAVLGDERFLAEIKITARLDHPHILTLIDSGAAGGFLYYVLPLVRGESLREKLNRDKQLGIEEAVAITKQVASALDYAHRHGVVHRDIKPENILLLEGEAMLTDFGIALAVKEAGGSRLTETGLSLGTPQYMSPEQATGDRQIDARSDLYSLAAVLYEMLAGEPPVTGPTAQAMIAKLMTERPTHLRVVRDSVPEAIDAAVARALDKTPADRFASAGDFARALEVRTAAAPMVVAGSRRPGWPVVLGALSVILLGGLGFLFSTGRLGHREAAFALRDRTQLTFSGTVYASAITPRRQAAGVHHPAVRRHQLHLCRRDPGRGGHRDPSDPQRRHRRLWAGVESRPPQSDLRRNLRRPVGDAPRLCVRRPTPVPDLGAAMFWAGGDSLLVSPPVSGGDSVFHVRVTTLGGVVADSIRVAGPGLGVAGLSVMPGGRWIVALVVQAGARTLAGLRPPRQGRGPCRQLLHLPGTDHRRCALAYPLGERFRVHCQAGDRPRHRRLATRQDTLLSGTFNNFSVTADGTTLVIDDGTSNYQLWATDLADALTNKFPENRRLLQATTRIGAQLSPDGARLLLARTLPSSTGRSEQRYTIMPFGGGERESAESPRNTTDGILGRFGDRGLPLCHCHRPARGIGGRAIRPDPRRDRPAGFTGSGHHSGSQRVAWIPATGDRVIVERAGRRLEIPKPVWFTELFTLDADPSGERLVFSGWNAGTDDSIGVAVVPIDGALRSSGPRTTPREAGQSS